MSSNLDELSKALAKGASRREALRLFAGGLVGMVLACFGLGAGAQKGPDQCKSYCNGRFASRAERAICMDVCHACPKTTLLCGTTGYNLVCCTATCCGGVCTDLVSSPNNCGACGHSCGSFPNVIATCSNRTCSYACSAGYADCDGNPSNGCETYLGSDPNNCGACGYVCAAGQICQSGVCNTDCGPYRADCDHDGICETDIAWNNGNCGGCGIICTAGTCVAGFCTPVP